MNLESYNLNPKPINTIKDRIYERLNSKETIDSRSKTPTHFPDIKRGNSPKTRNNSKDRQLTHADSFKHKIDIYKKIKKEDSIKLLKIDNFEKRPNKKDLNKTFDKRTIDNSICESKNDLSMIIPDIEKLKKTRNKSAKKEEIKLINNIIESLTKLRTIILDDEPEPS